VSSISSLVGWLTLSVMPTGAHKGMLASLSRTRTLWHSTTSSCCYAAHLELARTLGVLKLHSTTGAQCISFLDVYVRKAAQARVSVTKLRSALCLEGWGSVRRWVQGCSGCHLVTYDMHLTVGTSVVTSAVVRQTASFAVMSCSPCLQGTPAHCNSLSVAVPTARCSCCCC
jgi:hypothetical protein